MSKVVHNMRQLISQSLSSQEEAFSLNYLAVFTIAPFYLNQSKAECVCVCLCVNPNQPWTFLAGNWLQNSSDSDLFSLKFNTLFLQMHFS